MGIVYEALDRERGIHVALKTLLRVDGSALYRFKQEFRAVAEVVHPNLVTLYELFADGEQPFFTMELVAGEDLVTYVRGHRAPGIDAAPVHAPATGDAPTVPHAGLPHGDLGRLVRSMRQLAEGVAALHAHGKVHRDLKPSNVLVTAEGRVVVLDFGVVLDSARQGALESAHHQVLGTPEYMAPEQAIGGDVTGACDWYSVGTILHELLTGARPFTGSGVALLMAKQTADAPSVLSRGEPVPEDLARLCDALLKRTPAARPSGAAVVTAFGGSLQPTTGKKPQSTVDDGFVGRAHDFETLDELLASARGGRAELVVIRGKSGVGKSTLVRQFVAQPKVRAAALVLSGRCYERETTPYKALDAIIDALSAYLAHLPIAQASALLPVGVTRLARMFPVLRRVPAIVSWPEVDREEKDPHELRRRAFGALRELLARISLRTPVILCIDDLQWGDIDSAALLGEIMRPPEPPSLLVIATHRAAESEGETVLAALRDARKAYEADAPMHIVSLDPLSFEETVDLALTRLGGSGRANRAIAEAIAAEAQGLPFFVDELVRYLDTNDDTRVVVNLDEAIRARLASLAPSARALLIALCVAGHPLESGVAAAAAGLPDESTALSVLRAGSLVRRSAGPRKDMFEPYHDKVRAVVAASLDAAERATLHGRIANALETRGPSDPEVLFVHVREGGDLARAARYAEAAAVRAEEALAFDRAAALWREALELSGANGEASRVLWEKLASALSSAGRSVDAASAFERACDSAPAARALDLRRLAAEHLLRGGAIVEGIRASHEVLRSVGLSLPTTAFRTLLSIAWQTVRMRLRGFAFAARDESLVSPFVLAKADACWSVGASLAVVLPVTARLMQIEMVRLALDAGETRRVARSIGLLIATEIRGTRALAFSRRLIQIATPLVAQAKQPELEAWLAATIGIASYLRGEFQEARPRIEEAVEAFRVTCVGKLWEQANLAIFRGWTLFQLGELDELHRHVSRATQEASQRGDRYLATNIRLGVMNSVWLASDEPDRARTEVDLALANWGSNEVQVQVWHELLARAQADLYERKGDAALARIEATWDTLRRAHLFRIQIVASQAYHLLGRALLASKGGVLDKTARRSLAAARAIEKEGMPAATGWSAALRAGSFHAMGDVARARTELTRAAGGFDAHGMKLWSLAARRRVASLDDAPTTEIDARMQALGVRDTGRMTDCLVPGFAKR